MCFGDIKINVDALCEALGRPVDVVENPGDNRFGLLPAWRLYRNPTYGILAEHWGLDHLYILSAGWGLIPANFLTPNYDITFSAAQNVQRFKRWRHR